MEVTLLSGGTGTPKLLDGFREILDPRGVSVAVNVADDCVVSGNLVCPDIDTVLYTLSDRIDRDRWWGVEGDTERVHDALADFEEGKEERTEGETENDPDVRVVESNRRIGRDRCFSGASEFMTIGDTDRALHIYRTGLIDEGFSLTEATSRIAERLDIQSDVLPISNDPLSSWIETERGWMHFQEFWVAYKGSPDVIDIEFRGVEDASPTDCVLDAFENPVVVGPSNPVTSISPLLELPRVVEKLRETRVVAVSPFVGGELVSGPAADMMEAWGYSAGSCGVYDVYSDFLDVLVVDGEKPEVDCRVVEMDTMVEDRGDAERIAERLCSTL